MPVQPGDRIRILKDRLQCAPVAVGAVLTVTGFVDVQRSVIEASVPGDYRTWWFSVNREGTGFERVKD